MPSVLQERRFWLVFAAGWLLLVAGCGKKLITVEGNVTWQGKAVESGSISFAPQDGNGPTLGGGIKDGKYRLQGEGGVTPGKKTVTITAVRKTGKQVEAGPPEPPGKMVDEVVSITSTQSCEITDGKLNQQNFEIQAQASPR